MTRARTSLGISVSAQLGVLIGTLGVLVLLLASNAQLYTSLVTSIVADLDDVAGAVEGADVRGVATRVLDGAYNLWLVSWLIVALFAGLLFPLAIFIVRKFAVRLNDMTDKMMRISRNDIDVPVPFVGDNDELGDMARAVHVFKANARSLLEQQELIETLNTRFEIALNHMSRGLSMFDADLNLVVCNQRFRNMYGLQPALCEPGVSLYALVEARADTEVLPADKRKRYIERWYARHREIILSRKRTDIEIEMMNGRTVAVTYEPLRDGGCVAVHEDITQKRRRDEKINRLARQDSLTGVGNRFYFRERLASLCEAVGPSSGLAVHLIDLDRFKDVNDTLGHAAGDVLLRLVALRIQQVLRSEDLVARLGGDEFAVIQTNVRSVSDTGPVAQRLIESLAAPFQVQGQQVQIGASVGVALFPRDGSGPDDVIKKADIALYRAKDDGRGCAVSFRTELESELHSRHQLGVDLRHAIRESQFELHYQPIVSLDGGGIVGCEALMRWRHPLKGFIPPDAFIPVAEDLGLIGVLGEWGLKTACAEAAKWPGDTKVAVNLSPTQFRSCDLAAVTQEALDASGLCASRLEFEVTERLLLRDTADNSATLHKLREMGVRIALDDFGTGYASLSYLLSFPFDKIKIDRMFVRNIAEQRSSGAIVGAITNLARSMGVKTVAEGVEEKPQLDAIGALGCDEAQGYYFSRPVCGKEIVDVLQRPVGV